MKWLKRLFGSAEVKLRYRSIGPCQVCVDLSQPPLLPFTGARVVGDLPAGGWVTLEKLGLDLHADGYRLHLISAGQSGAPDSSAGEKLVHPDFVDALVAYPHLIPSWLAVRGHFCSFNAVIFEDVNGDQVTKGLYLTRSGKYVSSYMWLTGPRAGDQTAYYFDCD